jgi:meso-butanediol dehydrogenase / (S,S)-butanediol dehydrogenase / diacetyl reductase
MKLDKKIAIITGGGSGIGLETSKLFAKEGSIVAIVDRDLSKAQSVANAIHADGGQAMAIHADVTQSSDIKRMIDTVVTSHGRLDILVNNAGYGIAGTVVDTSEEDWNALMAVNVNGVYLGCKYAIPVMERQGGGVIVNTASTVSVAGITNRAAYVASKGAVAALTRAMALDHVGSNIRINAVGPGTIESPYFDAIFAKSEDPSALRKNLESRQPMSRMGQPSEIARAILFLASNDSSFCTGTTLFADGGWTAR